MSVDELVLALGAAEAGGDGCDDDLPLLKIRGEFQSLLAAGYAAPLALRLALRFAVGADEPALLLVR